MTANHYRTLGLSPGADERTIRRAYLDLARRHHPDRHPGHESAAALQAINHAYRELRDPARRAAHDREIGGLLRADFSRKTARQRVRGRVLGPIAVLIIAAGTGWLGLRLWSSDGPVNSLQQDRRSPGELLSTDRIVRELAARDRDRLAGDR